MKTIKIIDLLNKIANGEEVPKKIRIDGETLILDNGKELHYRFEGKTAMLCFEWYIETRKLNYEVEILDAEDEFEDIDEINIGQYYGPEDSSLKYDIVSTINQLIKNRKKIIERLNNLNND